MIDKLVYALYQAQPTSLYNTLHEDVNYAEIQQFRSVVEEIHKLVPLPEQDYKKLIACD
jgi:hypothetical protein